MAHDREFQRKRKDTRMPVRDSHGEDQPAARQTEQDFDLRRARDTPSSVNGKTHRQDIPVQTEFSHLSPETPASLLEQGEAYATALDGFSEHFETPDATRTAPPIQDNVRSNFRQEASRRFLVTENATDHDTGKYAPSSECSAPPNGTDRSGQEHRYRTHQHGNKYQQRFQEAAQAEEQAAQKEKGMEIITNKAHRGITKARAGEQTDYRRRFIIEAWRDGKPAARQVTVMDNADEAGNGKITLPVHLKLYAVEYTLAVWTDYVVAGTTTDLYYNTENLQQVTCTTPYTGSTGYRDCLYGSTTLDLRPYRDEWNVRVQAKVDMVRPLAKYRIIATDVQEFLAKTQRQRDAEGGNNTYTVTFSYGFYFPLGFNTATGKPMNSVQGVTFSTPLTIPDDGTEKCPLGSDFIFVNGTESFVPLNIELADANGKVVSRTRGLEVPYRRGHLTTLRGNFLTNEMQGGINIDTGYDDEIDIDLDSF